MRLLSAALLLLAALALPAAEASHGCPPSNVNVLNSQFWAGASCVGGFVRTPGNLFCVEETEAEAGPLHVQVLNGFRCPTGVVVDLP